MPFPVSMLLFCGAIYLLAAGAQRLWPPKGVNAIYGYRTRASMASPERWAFAQARGIREMALAGAGMLILSWPVYRLVTTLGWSEYAQLGIEMTILLVATVGMLWRVERALKDRFGPAPPPPPPSWKRKSRDAASGAR
jgi:hypothetical protein